MKHIIVLSFLLSFSLMVHAQSLTIGNGATVTVDGDGNEGTVLDVDGDLDIISGGELRALGDAQFVIEGNFFVRNNGDFDQAQSTVELNGSSAQSINLDGANITERFYNLVINNASGAQIIAGTSSRLFINNILTPELGTLTTNGDLLLRSSATIQARVAYGAGNVSGITRVEKQLQSEFADWRQIGLPVEIPTNTGDLNWDAFTNRLGILLDGYAPANRINTFVWNATDADGIGGSDFAIGWEPASDLSDETNAFNIYLSNNAANLPYHSFGTTSFQEQFEIDGELRSGDFQYNLAFTRDPADVGAANANAVGWNFIPNPWPAFLDIDELISAFVSDNTGGDPVYQAIHVWDATNTFDDAGQYRAIVNGVSKIDYNTPGNTIDLSSSSQRLDMFQGFWVKATEAGQVLNLTASTMQKTDFQGERFLKKQFETIRLNVFDQDSIWDQLVLYFNAEASREFDLNGDAYYLPSRNEQVPIFYAKEGTSKAQIVSRKPNTTDSVDVVFGSTKNQIKFYINADLDELGSDWHVYLKDKLNNKTYELTNGLSLPFSHFNGIATDRFVVYYSKNERAFNHLVDGDEANVVVFAKDGSLVLQTNGLNGTAEISVFDAIGRIHQRASVDMTTGEEYELEISTANQILIVETTINGQVFRNKVYH